MDMTRDTDAEPMFGVEGDTMDETRPEETAPRRKRPGKARRGKARAAQAVTGAVPVDPDAAAAATSAESPDPAETSTPLAEALNKAELIDLVVERSGLRKRDAKPAVEATLAILGQALADGRALNLRGLGKARHVAVKERDNARVINLRLRQSKQVENSAQDPLDPLGEEG
ncbi:HU family DNA-binding protein [Tropicibacter sp. S64]|uniref:HU family DNA-binding protein n=1 Tax=Tropicibacter sp. S64 TaxID=3415122 RepID=UPI003C7C7D61